MEIVKGIKKKGKSFLKAVLPEDTYERFITWQWLRRQEIKIARKGYYIPFIVISVGQACNFRCRDCGNFAPLAPAECRRYDVDTIINNIQCILKYAPYIEGMGVQGGEPFVYNDLDKLLVYLGEQKKENRIRNITIHTNGSIVPAEKVLNLLQEYQITVRISDYSVMPEKAREVQTVCEQKGIPCQYYEFATAVGSWYILGGIDTKRIDPPKIVAARFRNCKFNTCLTLEHGELWRCSRAPNAHLIQGFAKGEKDCVRVRDSIEFRNELRKYILRPYAVEACKYCNGTDDTKMVPAAIQL